MSSKLKDVLKDSLTEKEIKINDFQEKRLRIMERDLNDGKIELSEAMDKLKKEFRNDLRDEDYKRIEEELKTNMK